MQTLKHYIAYLGLRFLTTSSLILPANFLKTIISNFLSLSSYRLNVIESNIKASYPTLISKERQALKRLIYKNLSKVIASQLKGAKDEKIKYSNPSVISSLVNDYGSVLLLGSHFGCWEANGKMLTSLLDKSIVQYVAYKPVKNKFVDNFIRNKRSDTKATPIQMKSVYKSILTDKKNGTPSAYYLIVDQYPSSLQNIVSLEFLNQQTRFINGPEKIAKKLKIPVVFMDITISKEHTLIDLIPIYKPNNCEIESVIENYARLLERQVNRSPEHWLWSHKRWKNLR